MVLSGSDLERENSGQCKENEGRGEKIRRKKKKKVDQGRDL